MRLGGYTVGVMTLEALDRLIDRIRTDEAESGITRRWDIECHGDVWCVSGSTPDGGNRYTHPFPSQADAIYVVSLLRRPHFAADYDWDSDEAEAESNARLNTMLVDLTRAVVNGSKPR